MRRARVVLTHLHTRRDSVLVRAEPMLQRLQPPLPHPPARAAPRAAVQKYKVPVVAQRVGCVAACPADGWLAFQGKCYYFSEAEGNWTSCQTHCSALGASLAGIDTQQEMDFMLRYGGPRDHWIGLRNETGPNWRWVNSTKFNNWFPIGGGGQCVYLKEADTVSSSRCSLERHWICSKPQI